MGDRRCCGLLGRHLAETFLGIYPSNVSGNLSKAQGFQIDVWFIPPDPPVLVCGASDSVNPSKEDRDA